MQVVRVAALFSQTKIYVKAKSKFLKDKNNCLKGAEDGQIDREEARRSDGEKHLSFMLHKSSKKFSG